MSDFVFQGTSALSLDGKGRITVPARHREALSALSDSQLTLTKHSAGCLLMFPRPAWIAFRARLLELPIAAEGWRRLYLGSAVDVEVDSAARVLIPPELRNAAKLSKDVLLLGNGPRLEIWDAARHQAHEAEVMASEIPASIQGFVF